MLQVTVGIAQFFVYLLTQMAIVLLYVVAAAIGAGCGALALYRFVTRRRR